MLERAGEMAGGRPAGASNSISGSACASRAIEGMVTQARPSQILRPGAQ
jgi:hypothetical protein